MKSTLCLFVVCVSLGLTGCPSTHIITKKDNSYNRKLTSIYVISHVEASLGSSFSKAFAKILKSAFKLNKVDAEVDFNPIVKIVGTLHSDVCDVYFKAYLKKAKEEKKLGSDALMFIIPAGGVRGTYGIRQAWLDVSLIDMKSEKRIWRAKVKFSTVFLDFGFNPDMDYSGTKVIKDLANVLANDILAQLKLDGLI